MNPGGVTIESILLVTTCKGPFHHCWMAQNKQGEDMGKLEAFPLH